ncbi:MAG TPA: radical SAM/SPASM domain-containing protein [Polyangia bacterium]|jgi:Predicted Fe-S oxidoreductases|nr:radical SAM/SPASM domain-containing protein [Polyangia bacterium]
MNTRHLPTTGSNKLPDLRGPREVPRLVAIETTNACNAKCAFCPNSIMNRDRAAMSDDLYRKIIDDCASFQVQAIEPFLNGEPLMDPQIVPRLQYLRERLPATKLRLYSNGFALVPERVDELQGVGIDHLFISLNTLDPAKYEAVMGLRLDRTLRNIDYVVDDSRRTRLAREITIRMTRTDDTTAEDQARFLAYCKQRKVNCMIVGLFNYLGDVKSPLPVPSFPCEHITRVDILSSGVVTLCCMDAEGKFALGDASKESILDIYNGPRARAYRTMHRQGRRKQIPPCGTCNLFWPSFDGLSWPRRVQFGLAYAHYLLRYRPFVKRKANRRASPPAP